MLGTKPCEYPSEQTIPLCQSSSSSRKLISVKQCVCALWEYRKLLLLIASVWYPRTYSIRPRSSHFQANTTFRSGRYLKHCLAHRRLFDIVVNQLMLGTKPWLRSNSSINNVTFACGLLAMFMASRTEGRGACCSAHPIRPMRLLVEMRKWPGISLKFTAIGASYVPGVDSHNDDDLLHKQCNSANIRPWPINNVILPTFARGLLAMFMASRTGCWIVFIHLLLHSY